MEHKGTKKHSRLFFSNQSARTAIAFELLGCCFLPNQSALVFSMSETLLLKPRTFPLTGVWLIKHWISFPGTEITSEQGRFCLIMGLVFAGLLVIARDRDFSLIKFFSTRVPLLDDFLGVLWIFLKGVAFFFLEIFFLETLCLGTNFGASRSRPTKASFGDSRQRSSSDGTGFLKM